MKKNKIKILLIFFLITISCNKNNKNKKRYLIYDLNSKFPSLLEKDSLFLFSKSEAILDSILIKSKKEKSKILVKQIQRSLINSDSLSYIILFKINEKNQNVYQFYFDENYNFLKYENTE